MKTLLAAAAASALLGCGTSPAPQEAEKAERPVLEAKPLAINAASPEWQKVMEEVLRGRPGEEQIRICESQRRYELALAWFNKGDFEKAKIEAEKAVETWGENIAARKLLSEVRAIIVGSGPVTSAAITAADVEVQIARVRVEEAQLQITLHLIHGQRYYDARMYDQALKEFENAQFKILHLPYDVKAMNDLLPRVRESVARSKNARPGEDR